ncbi:MAG: DNA-processing protein DprA [Sphaerochaetaceae bacterium]|jgi:DNA processing protein
MPRDIGRYHEAMNYEALIRASRGGDQSVGPLFDRLSTLVDVAEPLPVHLSQYAKVSGVADYEISDAYYLVRACFERMSESDVILGRNDPLWPSRIDGFPYMPRYLYLRGDLSLLAMPSVSVIGTRSPSTQGKQYAAETAAALGKAGYAVASGLALGIDGVAHISALKEDLPTIAVIGTPLDHVYPPVHAPLQHLIEQHGLVVSRFSPAAETQKWFFLLRNRLMSAISVGSVVVEDRDGGGAVRQAGFALEQKKYLFLFQHVLDNKAWLWPRRLADKPRVFVVKKPADIPRQLERADKLVDQVKNLPKAPASARKTSASERERTADAVQLDLFS